MRRGIGKRVVRWLVVAAMCALPVQGFAGNVNTADIIDGAVTTPKIADGAITNAKISGIIGVEKIGPPLNHFTSTI